MIVLKKPPVVTSDFVNRLLWILSDPFELYLWQPLCAKTAFFLLRRELSMNNKNAKFNDSVGRVQHLEQ